MHKACSPFPWLTGLWLLGSLPDGTDLLIEGSTAGVNPGAGETQDCLAPLFRAVLRGSITLWRNENLLCSTFSRLGEPDSSSSSSLKLFPFLGGSWSPWQVVVVRTRTVVPGTYYSVAGTLYTAIDIARGYGPEICKLGLFLY